MRMIITYMKHFGQQLKTVALISVGVMMFSCNNDNNIYNSFDVILAAGGDCVNAVNMEKVKLDSIHCSGEGLSWINPKGYIYYYDTYFFCVK